MKRRIDNLLLNRRNEKKRKVLLVRGARQVGKTYSLRELGKSFEYFLEIIFEEEKGINMFFTDSINPQKICKKLSAYYSIPIVPDKTLLFFDEIQACPNALSSLRFFYEKMPELYYWHRESRGSNAEIDYVIQQGDEIIPIEVKSGTKGQMQSMFLFLKERKLKKGIRTSLENFADYGQILTVPLYALKNVIQ